jgi:hypothetical protein
MSDSGRDFLRHTVATLAYRGGKVVRDAPAAFASYEGGTRPPAKILAHIGDLLDWALSMADGSRQWHDSEPKAWEDECGRFFAALEAFDGYLASDAPLSCTTEKLFQGPVADALTHVGQLAMLRRMSGMPMKSENYFMADIASGRVGRGQIAPKREFD